MNITSNKPIFIVGVPRSGTTWVSNIFGAAKKVSLLSEPDNEKYSFIGRQWKKSHFRFPSGHDSESIQSLSHFYSQIFNGNFPKNRSLINHLLNYLSLYEKKSLETHIRIKENNLIQYVPTYESFPLITKLLFHLTANGYSLQDRLVIKSVHAGLILPFIYSNFSPDMFLIFRHPANVISSCLELNIEDANRQIFKRSDVSKILVNYQDKISQLNDPLSFMGLQVGIFYYLWENQLITNLNWQHITHEELCINSVEKYKFIFSNFNLNWDSSIERLINKMNQPGKGFKTYRDASLLKDKWKNKLNMDQIIKIQKGYSILPVSHYEEFKI